MPPSPPSTSPHRLCPGRPRPPPGSAAVRISLAYSELALEPPPPRPPRLHRACLFISAHVHALPASPSPSALSHSSCAPSLPCCQPDEQQGLGPGPARPEGDAGPACACPKSASALGRRQRKRGEVERKKQGAAGTARSPARRPGLPPLFFFGEAACLRLPRALATRRLTPSHTPTQAPAPCLQPRPRAGVFPPSASLHAPFFFVCAAPPACVRLCLRSRRQPPPPPPWPLPRLPPRPSSPGRRATSWPIGTRTRPTCRR